MPQIELNSAFNQSLYTQLSQNVSDSEEDDSDEDEVIRFQSLPNSRCITASQGTTASAAVTTPKQLANHPILMAPRTEEMYLNYAVTAGNGGTGGGPKSLACTLDLDGSIGTAGSTTTPTAADTVAILNDGGINSTNQQDDDESTGHFIAGVRKPMGPCRKVCFILSIIVCFASVVLFLWGLPCDNDLTCSVRTRRRNSEEERETSHNWIRDFDKVEFKSVISVTNGMPGYGKNLIFMYRSDKVFESADPPPHQHHNGIIALMGSRGQISWYDQTADEPSRIDCGLLDVDRNGHPDCLIIDEYGQIGCINPESGQWMWHISLYQDANEPNKSVRRKAIDLLDFPVILPDIDNDQVNDLLLITSLEQVHQNNFLFVSGRNGQPIGKAYTLLPCQFVHKLQLEEEGFMLVYNCINNSTELMKRMPLRDLYSLATNGQALPVDRLRSPKDIEQHKFYGQRRNTQNQRNIYSNGMADLIVENNGKCPYNCSMSMAIQLSGSEGSGIVDGNAVTIIQGTGMYGMVPAVLIPKKEKKMNGKAGESVTGFVVKFWEWIDEGTNDKEEGDGEQQQQQPPREQETTNGHARVKRDGEDEARHKFNWTFVKKVASSDSGRRGKRDATATAKSEQMNGKNDLVKRKLKEHVVLITFNGTTPNVINTSQEIVQFCRERTASGMGSFCQPDMNYQENSVTITDLDQDGNQELISFYSTFVETQDSDWKLVTYVQQVRLETELMSLYDT